MAAENVPLGARRNAPLLATFPLKNTDGSARDLTGSTARFTVRLYPGAPGEPLVSTGPTSADLTLGTKVGSGGQVTAYVDALTMALLPDAPALRDAVFAYDLVVTSAAGVARVERYGPLTVTAGVTADDLALLSTEAGDFLTTEAGDLLEI